MRNCACAKPWVAKMVYVPVLDELSFEELLRDLRRVLRLARASETSGGVITRPVKRFIKRLRVIRRHVENGDFQRARFEASAALRSYHASVEYVDAFSAERALTAEEISLLPIIVAMRLAMTVLITNWRANLYPDNRAYILRNEPNAWRGLVAMTEAEPLT